MKFFKKLFIFLFILITIGGGTTTLQASAIDRKNNDTINIAMATDNNYAYPLIVAMTSILENKKHDSKIDFYILHSDNLKDDFKTKILNLKKKYNNCKINLINMKSKYKNIKVKGGLTGATYYRLDLPLILNNLDKILYLDCDIIVHTDLKELYNTDIKSYWIAGIVDMQCRNIYDKLELKSYKDYAHKFGFNSYAGILGIPSMTRYLNAGILLMNLNELRNDNIPKCFDNYIRKYRGEKNIQLFNDQDIINGVCYDKILTLPNKYNLAGWLSGGCISHYLGGHKPWHKFGKNVWWKYALKTGYIKDIRTNVCRK